MDLAFKWWDGVFKNPVVKNYRVSFCTTCMNRLADLKLTLPENIKDNAAYPDAEFVVLDYNSKDGLGDWVKSEMMEHIESGRLVYYRTEEPVYYSMTHSRNIAFKVATGEVVNSVDADNYMKVSVSKGDPERDTRECFASYLNRQANEAKSRAIFVKSKRVMHGRIGFFKQEFLDDLGGYDENILGYGGDDHDVRDRALALGYTMFSWSGMYYARIHTGRKTKNANLERYYRITEAENKIKCQRNLDEKRYRVNEGIHWGKARLVKNFTQEMEI